MEHPPEGRSRPPAPRGDEALFRLLVESVQDYAIFLLDRTGHVVSWNAGAQRIKGYSSSEILGSHFSRFYPPDDVASGKVDQELEVAARVGRFEDEGWRIRKDGARFWANVAITALRGEGGELLGFAKVTRDLTERRRAEQDRVERARAEAVARVTHEMAERERAARLTSESARALLATTLRSLGEAVIATDAEGRISMMNPLAERLTGWSEGESVGRPLEEVFRIEDEQTRARVESPFDAVARTGAVVAGSHSVLLARSGARTPVHDSGAPIRDPEGRIAGVVVVFRDATAEKSAQLRRAFLAEVSAALSSSLDYHQTLATIASLAVPHLADWCTVHLLHPGHATAEQIAVAHADPTKLDLVRAWAAKSPPSADAPRGPSRVIRGGASELYREISDGLLVEAARDDEHLRLARALDLRSALVVPIAAGPKVLGAITFVYAGSDRRYDDSDVAFAEDLGRRAGLAVENATLYEEATRARRVADEANQSKDRFLAAVSHELRTPLNAIAGWANLIRSRAVGEEKLARAIETIARNAQTMTAFVEDLLDVSRIVSGQMRLEMAPVELVPIVEAAIDVVRPAAEAKSITLESSLETEGRRVVGDAVRLQQVAWNLLSNAVKFTPEGGRVRVTLGPVGSGIDLAVADTGKGIEPGFLPHVFEPFRQADGGATRSTGGLGLGLSITKHLVESHGGRIEVQSAGAGRGATFRVHLPTSPSSTMQRDAHGISAMLDHLEDLPELHGRRVLVVDDDDDTRVLVCQLLERCGAEMETASSAAQALAAVERDPPDVLVSDIGMPHGDGYELMRRIRALPAERGGNIPAAAVTAYASAEDRRRALAAGYLAHVTKPFDPHELCAVVAALTRFSPRRTKE